MFVRKTEWKFKYKLIVFCTMFLVVVVVFFFAFCLMLKWIKAIFVLISMAELISIKYIPSKNGNENYCFTSLINFVKQLKCFGLICSYLKIFGKFGTNIRQCFSLFSCVCLFCHSGFVVFDQSFRDKMPKLEKNKKQQSPKRRFRWIYICISDNNKWMRMLNRN